MLVPNVLLLGNGINLAYGGTSWIKMLEIIGQRDDLPDVKTLNKLNIPMPLLAILVSNDHLSTVLQGKEAKHAWYGRIASNGHRDCLDRILDLPVDEFLTTNYSYELEMAALKNDGIDEKNLKAIKGHSDNVKDCETIYRLYTYNKLPNMRRVWHIHGEANAAKSIVLGHYYYANNLAKMESHFRKREKQHKLEPMKKSERYNSWLDAFILGNVYILGFGFDFSEIDLWWLLNRKKLEGHGKVYFYQPQSNGFDGKAELLKLMNVQIVDCGFLKKKWNSKEYKEFYDVAIRDIQNKITEG